MPKSTYKNVTGFNPNLIKLIELVKGQKDQALTGMRNDPTPDLLDEQALKDREAGKFDQLSQPIIQDPIEEPPQPMIQNPIAELAQKKARLEMEQSEQQESPRQEENPFMYMGQPLSAQQQQELLNSPESELGSDQEAKMLRKRLRERLGR